MKKKLAMLLASLAIFSLTGCGDEKKPEQPAVATQQESKVDFQKATEDAVHKALNDEEIVSVKHDGAILSIELDETKIKQTDGTNIPIEMLQVQRVSAVGDKIVSIPNFDDAVKTVIVKFHDGKKVELPTSIIKKNDYNMRFFPSEYIEKNLK